MSDIQPLPSKCGGPALNVLRRFDADELATAERTTVQVHLDGCDACRGVLREFASDRAAVQLAVPFEALAARAEKKKPLRGLLHRIVLALALPTAAAAATAFMLSAPVETDGHTVRPKGAALEFVVKTPDGARPGADGEALKAGDTIRFRYDAQNKGYVLIVGVNASGEVFPYLAERERSASAAALKDFAPNAVTLDADPRPERVFALFSDEPIAVDELKPAARDAIGAAGDIVKVQALPLSLKGVEQATVLLNKKAE